ncbi:MAG: prepilin-type N-terminal cleavage/methylation domain-containing protein [Verrucomicrobia bacterium]|nr:prepilin-type N-terminal cleavage/methylation domain-containing protein [Verrucomicrobiota bacterium]
MKTKTQYPAISNRYSVISNQFPVSGIIALRTPHSALHTSKAFSLIELLVVIGVIVVLAAMTFPIMGAVKRAQAIHRARAELSHIETAIEAYKTKLGFYPPDNPPNWTRNQLYFELLGTTPITVGGQPAYQTLDSRTSIRNVDFTAAFGSPPKVTGFMNFSKAGAGDDAPVAVNFLTGLKAAQFLAVSSPFKCTVLGVSMDGWPVCTGLTSGEIVPYGYNSSDPKHNLKSFDLWVDIIAGGKTNRISNWSDKPIVVYYTTLANSYP